MGFVAAVEVLSGGRAAPPPVRPRPTPPKPFSLPETNRCPSAVVAYLQDRGIDPELIGACMQSKILMESKKYRNCVFVGRDKSGRARAATLRGTRDTFKIDIAGSDKNYSFCVPAGTADCPRLAVAESPIDALSLATLVKRSGGDWKDSHYLSLGGTGPRAMLQFLHDHPEVTQISLCLDNDKAGLEGMERLEQAIRSDSELAARVKLVHRNPPPAQFGKDYNEFLCAQVAAEKGVNTKKRSISTAR